MQTTQLNMANYRPIEELIPLHWQVATIEANGIKQHYHRTGGNKPVLILLHGIQAGGLNWLRVAKALEADYDVIMPDARGHGLSERLNNNGFDYNLLTGDVVQFIRALTLNKPALLGHSMGGTTAALVAANHPDLISALLIEDSVWGGDTSKFQAMADSDGYKAWINNYLNYLEQLKTQTHAERLTATLPQLPPGGATWVEEDLVAWVAVQAQLDINLIKSGASLWSMLTTLTPMSDLVKQISVPILLMTGGKGNTDPQLVQQVLANWHNGQYIKLEEAGHFIHIDQFDKYVDTITRFMQSLT